MTQTILVTGATGTGGNQVVKQLSNHTRNINIRAGGRSIENVKRVVNFDSAEPVAIDYYKSETISEAVKGVDSIFLVTPFQFDMVELTSNLLKAAKENDVKHMVMLSSGLAAYEYGSTVGRLHRKEEKIIEESRIPFTFLRPNAFMQNFINFFGHSIRTHNAIYLPTRDQKVSFIDARDIAAVAAWELTRNGKSHNNKIYNITGETALSYSQTAEIISREIDRKISYIEVSEEDARKGMKEMGLDHWLIEATMDAFSSIRAGYASQTTTVIEEITGRKPNPSPSSSKITHMRSHKAAALN